MYTTGKGVKRDYKEANKWYLKAAERGHIQAQGNLGMHYLLGIGNKDYLQSYKWLTIVIKYGKKRRYIPVRFILGLFLPKLQKYEAIRQANEWLDTYPK